MCFKFSRLSVLLLTLVSPLGAFASTMDISHLLNANNECRGAGEAPAQAACERNRLGNNGNELEQIIVDGCSSKIAEPEVQVACFNRGADWLRKYSQVPPTSNVVDLDRFEAGLISGICYSFGFDDGHPFGNSGSQYPYSGEKFQKEESYRERCYLTATANLTHDYMRVINFACENMGSDEKTTSAKPTCYQRGLDYLHSNKEPAPYEGIAPKTDFISGLAQVVCEKPESRSFTVYDSDKGFDGANVLLTDAQNGAETNCFSAITSRGVNDLLGRQIVTNQLMDQHNQCDHASDVNACYRASLADLHNHPTETIRNY